MSQFKPSKNLYVTFEYDLIGTRLSPNHKGYRFVLDPGLGQDSYPSTPPHPTPRLGCGLGLNQI